jgi:hypothetical protein
MKLRDEGFSCGGEMPVIAGLVVDVEFFAVGRRRPPNIVK